LPVSRIGEQSIAWITRRTGLFANHGVLRIS
jgi:hypothetical protein